MAGQRGWLLLTNDDGIEAIGFSMLVKALHADGYPLVVLAPSGNHSATGMRINLMKPMPFVPGMTFSPHGRLTNTKRPSTFSNSTARPAIR